MTGPPNSDRCTDQPPAGQPERAAQPGTAVEEAIQSGCGTLAALQASLASVETIPGKHERVEASLRAAITLVREAVAELRQHAATSSSSQLALGFVVERPPS